MLPLRTSREASALPGPRSRDAGSNRSWAFSQGRLLEPSRLSWDAAAAVSRPRLPRGLALGAGCVCAGAPLRWSLTSQHQQADGSIARTEPLRVASVEGDSSSLCVSRSVQ